MSVEKTVRQVLAILSRGYGRLLDFFSASDPFVCTDGIDWVVTLESNWRIIRQELQRVREVRAFPALIDIMPSQRQIANERWKMLMFEFFNRPIPENCALCPRTVELLKRVPGLTTASFSVLEAGIDVPPHRGLFDGVLRYHLGLDIPDPPESCGLRVGGEVRHWREGASLLFSDTKEHEAWNHSDRDRIVLFLDVKRPLPWTVRWLNEIILFILSRLAMPRMEKLDGGIAERIT